VSLRTRIAVAAGVAVAGVVIFIAVFTYVAVRSQLRGEVDDSLRQRTDRVAQLRVAPAPGPGAGAGFAAPPPTLDRVDPGEIARLGQGVAERLGRFDRILVDEGPFGGAGGFAQLVTADGEAIRPPGDAALPVPERAQEIAAAGSGSYLTDMTVDGTHLRVLTEGVRDGLAVQLARPLEEIDKQLSRILIALIAIGAVGIAGGAGLGAFVARTALVPIARFTERTEALSAEPDPSERMDVVGDDELARLARSFNTTLDALERSVQAQRQLVADASHELRTPIASLRANIQLLGDAERLPDRERERMREDIVRELDELTALVGDVVELARGSKPPEELDDVRLDDVVRAIVAREQRRSQAVDLRAELAPTLVQGDPERIGRAVSNLIGNAVKWSPPQEPIELALRDGVLSVRDHGPGFDPADLPHVFERFYRSAAARGTSGSGLGLAIVQQAAEAHGGFVEATNADGGGALLRVGFGPTLELAVATESAPPLVKP
jgi:two-component system, OmpR family, sensor histidine kinase MprB